MSSEDPADWATAEAERLLPCSNASIGGYECSRSHYEDCPAFRQSVVAAALRAAEQRGREQAFTQLRPVLDAVRARVEAGSNGDEDIALAEAWETYQKHLREREKAIRARGKE